LFTQYYTILFTDDGLPTPYFVRGVLLNPNNVESALDTIYNFENIDFSSAQDAIGHNWKAVMVDEGINSAEYNIRKGYTYIIKDTNEEVYSLRVTSFFVYQELRDTPHSSILN